MSIGLRGSRAGEFGIPLRMLLHPLPGAGNQHRRIARTPSGFDLPDWFPGDPPSGLDDFAHGEPSPTSQVVDEPIARAESFQGQDMSVGKIAHVDVITNAGSIFGRIVRPEDRDLFPFSRGRLKYQRNQV